ncbi:hypothetical protein EAE96_010170 [Botrytis aclada]|nr:hypothetical protein EAE96_010170 [Botrytis aclada]
MSKNGIVCHHASFIGANAIQKTKIVEETKKNHTQSKFIAIEPTIAPPQPETYTGHLAVLRNPTHKEWTTRPHRYLSPTLCNISPYYVKRFVEPPARGKIIEGKSPGKRHEFTMAKAQEDEIKKVNRRDEHYKKVKEIKQTVATRQRKKRDEFEEQLEILMTKIQEIRWERAKDVELCEYLETLVGAQESEEQQREYEEHQKECLARLQEIKKFRNHFVKVSEARLYYARRTADISMVEAIAKKHEDILQGLAEFEEELDEKDAREWREEERKEGRNKGLHGGKKGAAEKDLNNECVKQHIKTPIIIGKYPSSIIIPKHPGYSELKPVDLAYD